MGIFSRLFGKENEETVTLGLSDAGAEPSGPMSPGWEIPRAVERRDIRGVLRYASEASPATRKLVVKFAGKLLEENNAHRIAERCVEILRTAGRADVPADTRDELLRVVARAYCSMSTYGTRDLGEVIRGFAAVGAPAGRALNACADELAAHQKNHRVDHSSQVALDGLRGLAARLLAGAVCVEHSLDTSCKCTRCGSVVHSPDAHCVCRKCGQTDHKWSNGVYNTYWYRCERCGKERHIHE